MLIDPNLQTKLIGLNEIFDELSNLFINNKLPSKILLSGPKGSGKSTLAYHFANFIFSKNEKYSYNYNEKTINNENKSFILINNKTHPNFFLVDLQKEKKSIEISQTREMINYINKSSLNQLPRIILIDNAEYLNKNSLNSLLKIVEEPNYNVSFIFIHNSNKKIPDTLKSRCLLYKINLSFKKTLDITKQLLNENLSDLLHEDFISYYFTPGDFINFINFSKENNIDLSQYNLNDFLVYLINEKLYLKNSFVKSYIFVLIELYFLKIFSNDNNNKILDLYTKFIYKINNTFKYNLDHEALFLEFKSKVLNE